MTGEFWAPVVEGPTGDRYVHFGAARYREDAARQAWRKLLSRRRRPWRERNKMIEIQKFKFSPDSLTTEEFVDGLPCYEEDDAAERQKRGEGE